MNSLARIFMLSSFFIAISCNNHKDGDLKDKKENTYILKGKIEDRDSGWLYLGMNDTSKKKPLIIFDSAQILLSNFEFKGKFINSVPCKIMVKNLEFGWPYTYYTILDTGLTNVQLFKDSMANSIIVGPKSQEQLNGFNKKMRGLEISFQKNYPLYKKGYITADSLNALEGIFYRKKYGLILQYVKEMPGSIVSAFIAWKNLSDEIDISTLEDIYNSISNKDNYYARIMLKTLVAKKQSGIGIQAPYFKIIDNKNRVLTNDTFKGKYLLLDFWASWCVPCREESPYLVKAYKKFGYKGLEMISISSDINKRNWENAVKMDKLEWIQVCDLKGPDSKIVQDFGVLGIPTNYLIDKEGRIVAKNLRGKDMEKELQRFLEKN